MKILFLAIVFIISSEIFAQDARTSRLSLGAGAGIKKNLRVGNTYEDMDRNTLIRPIPFIQGSVGRFSLGPQGLSFMATGNHLMNASVFITRTGDRYQGAGMRPRKDSVFTGLSLKIFKYGLNISHDINGRSKGVIANLSYGEFFKITESIMLRAGLNLDWHDDRYAEYYYGVRSYEATATRREYHLNNYFQPGISFLPIYKLSESTTLTSAISFKYITENVRNSPTMNRDRIDIGGLIGFSYNL